MGLFKSNKFKCIKQHDSMQCGVSCLAMICRHYGKDYSLEYLDKFCHANIAGVSMLGIADGARNIGFETMTVAASTDELKEITLPCILHWNQNHFVVLYDICRNGKRYKIADPGKGLISYTRKELESHWISSVTNGVPSGTVMQLTPRKDFYSHICHKPAEKRSFRFLFEYLKQYRKYFLQIVLGLAIGCVLQLIMPFLTQWVVDIGIRHKDIGFIWLVLLGELMIVIGRTATDFIRRWLLLHISMRINISLVSDFFIKLLKLPMSFFDTKLMGDLLQRIGDHTRVQNFLTGQVLNIIFTFLSFVIFGIVLFIYNTIIFVIFSIGSIFY